MGCRTLRAYDVAVLFTKRFGILRAGLRAGEREEDKILLKFEISDYVQLYAVLMYPGTDGPVTFARTTMGAVC